MFDAKRNISLFIIYLMLCLGSFLFFCQQVNKKKLGESEARLSFLRQIYIASPAVITGGRNIAFETGTAISNAPASYLNLLDCCESDEAIASRIAIGQTSCRIIKGH